MKKLFALLGFLGFIFLIGTAGASDAGNIPFVKTVLQCLVSFGAMGIGYIGILACDLVHKKAQNKILYLKKREMAKRSFDEFCSKAA